MDATPSTALRAPKHAPIVNYLYRIVSITLLSGVWVPDPMEDRSSGEALGKPSGDDGEVLIARVGNSRVSERHVVLRSVDEHELLV